MVSLFRPMSQNMHFFFFEGFPYTNFVNHSYSVYIFVYSQSSIIFTFTDLILLSSFSSSVKSFINPDLLLLLTAMQPVLRSAEFLVIFIDEWLCETPSVVVY